MKKPGEEKSTPLQTDHSQRAYNGIRRMMYHKELGAGQKITSREIAERLDMSLTPVIQALKWLEFQGFVRHEPNRGYFLEALSLAEVNEIYEIREALEPALIPEIIQRLDRDGVAQLRKALDAHLTAGREVYLRDRLYKDVEFHLTLASLSKKTTHIRMLRNIFDFLFLKYGDGYLSFTEMKIVDCDHQDIFDFVIAGDVKMAQTTLLKHISNVKKHVVESFRKIIAEREDPDFYTGTY